VIDARAQGQFVPAVIVDDQQGDLERASAVEPSIVVELAGGVRVTIGRSAMAPMVSVVLRALR